MKVFQINGGSTGSTGRIMFGIRELAAQQDMQVLCASPVTSTNRQADKSSFVRIGGFHGRRLSELAARITGLSGCFSWVATAGLLREMKRFAPDVVHLHTLHSSFVNLPILFRYLRKIKVPVVWTLHDCWAFTGHCPHFTYEKCERWKQACGGCPRYRQYPVSLFDNSGLMFRLKKRWFTGLPNLTLVTPSQWLAGLVKRSFLGHYPVEVINNGVDLEVFTPGEGDFRRRYGLEGKKIVLGVAYGWDEKKGLDVFIRLAERLNPSEYRLVLVGTDERVDRQLPAQILSIHRTQDQRELAQIYGAADVFVNPTREDTFPTVNIEALACGTPVVTFQTGGSPEIPDGRCGCVVPCGDADEMESRIIWICRERPFEAEACRRRAENFDRITSLQRYLELYRRMK